MNNLLMKDGSIETVADFDDALDVIREKLGGEICNYIISCFNDVSADIHMFIYYLEKIDPDFLDDDLKNHIHDCKEIYKY